MTCSICLGEHPEGMACAGTLTPASSGAPIFFEQPVPANPDDALLGNTLGSFKIARKLGRGGMGAVFLGEHTVIGSKVAIKVLHPHLATNAELVSRFYAEARAVNLIGHENIVNIFDMGIMPASEVSAPRYYLVMEYLEGTPLNILTNGPVEPIVAIPILMQVCDALSAAHGRGIAHRDLKPENIFLIKRGSNRHFVKILDFGIAKLFAGGTFQTETSAGMIVGTPEFMAPEQTAGEKVDGRADIYSLGIIGYLLATGTLPFTEGGLTGILIAQRTRNAPPAHQLNPLVPRAFSDVLAKAMAKNPAERFKTAAEFHGALEKVLTWLTAPLPAPISGSSTMGVPPPPAIAPIRLSDATVVSPRPSEVRHLASFNAELETMDGKKLGPFKCTDVSKGGLFLCSDGALPPVFAKLRLKILLSGATLNTLAEVVRHVTPEQAAAWGMSPGFGVQYVEVNAQFRDDIGRVVQGLPLLKTPRPPRSNHDDATAEPLLTDYRRRLTGDHYTVLALPLDADFSDVRVRARDARREIDAVKLKNLSPNQHAQIQVILSAIDAAVQTLTHPVPRAEYDARRGNFKGVARAISAGISVTQLEELRAKFLEAYPTHDAKALIHFTTATVWESKQNPTSALEELEKALKADPLQLKYQQRYWSLKRRAAR